MLAFACWRGSDLSVDDARTSARMAAEEVAARAAQSGEPPRAYLYGERPMREEVVRELAAGDGGPAAVVTRNSFGCLVLNTARVMFVDVDLPGSRQATSSGGWLARLLGRGGQGAGDGAEARALERLDAWVRTHPGTGFRVYRTRAGLRYLETSGLHEPASDRAEALLGALGCDPLYVRLCRAQQSFRARLTPKPWRCGIVGAPVAVPARERRARGGVSPMARALRRYVIALRHVRVRLGRRRGPRARGGRADPPVPRRGHANVLGASLSVTPGTSPRPSRSPHHSFSGSSTCLSC